MKKNRGFTLIEILIVLVVIGILAAIAIPSYQNQLRKSSRAAAIAVLSDVANKEIFYLQSQRTYWDCAKPCAASSLATNLGVGVPDDVTNFYDLGITKDDTTTPPSFVATATPKSGRQAPDGWIALDSAGKKTSEFSGKW
jgi:type IV pilus assembly protein PilE